VHCGFQALVIAEVVWPLAWDMAASVGRHAGQNRGYSVKKVALAFALVVAALSLGGCFVGKGKAPAPVITKG